MGRKLDNFNRLLFLLYLIEQHWIRRYHSRRQGNTILITKRQVLKIDWKGICQNVISSWLSQGLKNHCQSFFSSNFPLGNELNWWENFSFSWREHTHKLNQRVNLMNCIHVALTSLQIFKMKEGVDDVRGVDIQFIICAVYLLLGMALIAMCFNLMQEQVINNIRAFKRGISRCFRCHRCKKNDFD